MPFLAVLPSRFLHLAALFCLGLFGASLHAAKTGRFRP